MWNPTHVQVTVHRAKNLIAKGKAGTNDTYVTIHLGKEKYQTSVKDKSVAPEWNEECDLLIPDKKAGETKLTVFHRNLLGLDQFLGFVSLPLNEFQIYERPRSRWYTLRNKPDSKKAAKERGEIEAKVTFIVQSTPAASSATLSKTSLSSSALSLSMLKKPKSIKSLAHSMGDKLKVKGNLLKSSSKTDLSRSRESLASNQSSNISSLTQSSTGGRASPSQEKTPPNKTFNPVKEEPSERLEEPSPLPAMHCRSTSLGSQHVAQSMLDLRSSKIPEVVVVDKPPVTPVVEQSRMTRSEIDLGESAMDDSDNDERSLYGRGRFSTQSHDFVRKPSAGEPVSSLNILPEEQSETMLPSGEVWSSTIEQQNAANKANSSVRSSTSRKSDVISEVCSETDGIDVPVLVRSSSRPTSTIIEGPIDFRRLSIGSKGDKDERRSSLRYGVKEIVNSADADLYETGDYKLSAADDQRSFLPAEILDQYKTMTREDLIRMAYIQKVQLEKKEAYIKEMENYLDNLLVRVIETSPTILQNPYEKKPQDSQQDHPTVVQRPMSRTGKVTLPGIAPPPVTANTVAPPRTNGTNKTVPPKVVTHSRKAVKPNALKNPKKSLSNPFKKISAALK